MLIPYPRQRWRASRDAGVAARPRRGTMLAGQRVAVVVPAHNEARWIAEVLGSMPRFVDLVVVVDDASSDATAAIARAAPTTVARRVVELTTNVGVGGAIVAGYRVAVAANMDVVAVMAGDGQMAPDDLLPLVLSALSDGGYAKGERMSHRDVRRHMPAIRWWGSQLLSRLTSWAVGSTIVDSQCGFTAIHRRALEQLDLNQLWTRYGYPNDLLGLLAAVEVPIVELPVKPRYRGEASGLRAHHFLVMLALVARARFRTRSVRQRQSSKKAATA